MPPLTFGDPESIARRDEAVAGAPIRRMYASFGGPDRTGLCDGCRHFDRWSDGRPRTSCAVYSRTHGRTLSWPELAYSCGRFEPKTPNAR